jgi:hypothetical protein
MTRPIAGVMMHGEKGEYGMNLAMRVAIAGMIAWAAASGVAQQAGPSQPAAPAQPAVQTATLQNLQVKEVNLAEIDTSHVKLAVDLNLTSAQSVTMESVRLCSLHLNGMPVFAAPLNQEIVLKKGVPTALPPLYITVLFRDLRTVEPLRRMIEKQSVRIEGEMVADVRLTMVEKMALHTQHPSVEISLGQDVPVQLSVSDFQRSLALSALGYIDIGLQATAAADKLLPGAQPQWIRDLETNAKANLFAVESSYTLAQKDTSFPVVSLALGFRAGSGTVVTTAEALAPWKYDTEFLNAVQSGAAKLEKNSQEIQLRPVGLGDPLRLSAKDFTVDLRGTPEGDKLIAVGGGGHGKIEVLRRASPASLAVLTLQPQPAAAPGVVGAIAGLASASAAVVAQDSWDQVVIFRLRENAVTKKPSVEALQMKASREGKGIHLSEPVDAAVFGSPIATPDGVIGLVQDEQTGVFLPNDLLAPVAAPAAPPAPAH